MRQIVVAFEQQSNCDRLQEALESTGEFACLTCRSAAQVKRTVGQLRRELEGKGYAFQSGSDCELLLPLYREYGTDLFAMLDAEFACVIYDGKTGEFIAARDPIGIRPLYYGYDRCGVVVFASEPKNLMGIVDTVMPFPPGHYYRDGKFVCYRDMAKVRQVRREGLDRVCAGIREKLIAGVEKRLVADAKVGFLLSGGLDSSLVCAIAARACRKPIKTFAIGMDIDAIDLMYARQAAEYIGSDHTEVIITRQDVLDSLETVVELLGTYDITTIRASVGMYLVCKAIHQRTDIRVILTGEISDELFGYKYTDYAPGPQAFQEEAEKRIRELHMYDVLQADRCISVNSLEARVPFGDLDFVEYVMSIDPEKKLNRYGKGKYLLRKAFEGDWLPEGILWREKAAFSDAVGHSLVDDLKQYAGELYTDEAFQARRQRRVTGKMKVEPMIKYIFVTGGVVSGLGKGITAASLGRLLKQRGLRVRVQKLDPYLNVDPGTMSPYQHGEVFVTDDGAETDLDLGHYERFIDESLTVNSSVSAGKVYWNVLNRERAGDYLGGTVQIIPHITDEIKRRIYSLEAPGVDAAIVEIGGTVGDIESQPFLEAIRQVAAERGRNNVMFIHVSLIVAIPGSGELKSKPTQHSAKELLSLGIQPDVIMCRSDSPVSQDILDKISLFCNIPADHAIPNLTADLLYEVPLMLEREGLADVVVRRLGLICHMPDLTEWATMVHRAKHPRGTVTVALVGKYVGLHDAYLSVAEALTHGGIENEVSVDIRWVNSEEVTPDTVEGLLRGAQGILVPGGFGGRGIEGKIEAIRYARENRVPFLGICLGMQLAVVEYARHVCALEGAHSSELDPKTPHPVIDLMPDQVGVRAKGGTMRLGSYPCHLAEGSLAAAIYGTNEISERHRHRYEFNNEYREALTRAGLVLSGLSPDGRLVEMIELPGHPWFVAGQFHPELKSRPNRAHPLFREFIRSAKQRQAENITV